MSIQIQNLTKLYGEQLALNNISFEIPQGQIVGFLGPNGAGKSTTMKILTSFIPPSSGTAKLCGYNVMEQAMEVKKRIGYLPENNPLYKDMYVKEFLHYVANVYAINHPLARITDLIGLTGLTREQDKKIHQLSKGYKQRVGIAQAMIHNPEVLILDEPTSGLDPNQLDEIRKLIIAIGKEKTVMLSTHIMQEVEAMCERVIIINKGEIVADNTAKNIKSLGSKEAIVRVEFGTDIAQSIVEKLPNIAKIDKSGSIYLLTLKDKNTDIRQDIFNLAVEQKSTILSMNIEERDLEGIFKELTK
jgi:ABC-2 type transport system ATP-binding protein